MRSDRWALSLLLVIMLAVLVVPVGTVAWHLRRLLAVIRRRRHDPEHIGELSRRAPSAFGQSCPDA